MIVGCWTRQPARQRPATVISWRLVCREKSALPALQQAISVVAEHMARSQDGEDVQKVVRLMVDASPDVTGPILAGWSKGWPRNSEISLDSATEDSLLELFDRVAGRIEGTADPSGQVLGQ